MYLLLVVQVTSWCMKRLPRKVWHRIHLTSFAVFVMGTVHGVLAGADSSNVLVQFGAVAGTTIVLFLVLVRLLNASGAIVDDDARPADARSRAAATRAARAAAVTEPGAVTQPPRPSRRRRNPR